MKVSEAITAFGQVGDTLTKASEEIKKKIEELLVADPDISPEGVAAIDRVKAIADALDAIVPDGDIPPDGFPPIITPIEPDARRR